MEKKETIDNCVHHYRTKLGMTQQQLAKKVDVTRQTIIAIEKGHYVPSVLLAIKIAKIFNQPVEEVFAIGIC